MSEIENIFRNRPFENIMQERDLWKERAEVLRGFLKRSCDFCGTGNGGGDACPYENDCDAWAFDVDVFPVSQEMLEWLNGEG